jgi:hypothetical protein
MRTFALEVAGNLMMKQPIKSGFNPGTYLPHNLIEKLSDINSQSDFVGGQWDSTDMHRRWSMDARDVDADYLERSSTGTLLRPKLDIKLETFDLNGSIPTTWRIERMNDAETLRFLGAKEKLIDPILKLGPLPSYCILKRLSTTNVQLAWYGLIWRVNSKGELAGIDQPGTKPPKQYPMTRRF